MARLVPHKLYPQPIRLPDIAPCDKKPCTSVSLIKVPFSGVRDIWQPMTPEGRYLWAGTGDFTRAHKVHHFNDVAYTCVNITHHKPTYFCLKKIDEFYQWGDVVAISNPVSCLEDQVCHFQINRHVSKHMSVVAFTPGSYDEWINKLHPSVPSRLGVAVKASMFTNRTVSFKGPGTKILWFKPLQFKVLVQVVANYATQVRFSIVIPLTTKSEELDGIFGISDPKSFKFGHVAYSSF
ncbi:hypothetical protein DSO57_1018183 [Entomophthora muscae]|uniref:Uncharacterized protein n=1 Tax=Entomophthora muscae TaxID=34485 RepID=A0ACC2RJ36_9FUNG|nr:hypothetical protein DSO57_1018183 [Entomophthora muscae]